MALSAKQDAFIDEYLLDLNATRAAKVAGYTSRSAGPDLLKNPNMRKEIARRMSLIQKQDEMKIADVQEVLRYLTSVMRGESVSEYLSVEGIGDGVSHTVKVEKNPSESEKLRAAELLAKRYGLLTKNVNVSGAVPVVISGEDQLEDEPEEPE